MKPAGLKTTKPKNSTDHRPGLSLSVAPNEFRSTLVGPGSIRPHLEEERNAGAHPGRQRIRGSGKTSGFKPATFRGFRNVAKTLGLSHDKSMTLIIREVRECPFPRGATGRQHPEPRLESEDLHLPVGPSCQCYCVPSGKDPGSLEGGAPVQSEPASQALYRRHPGVRNIGIPN